MPHQDPTALQLDLFLRYEGDVKRYIQSQLSCQKLSEDLTQETWLRFSRMRNIEHISDIKSFLFKIAGNLAIDHLRHKQVESRAQQLLSNSAESSELDRLSPERFVSGQQQVSQLNQALTELPPQCRVAFSLHRMKGKSYSEIAKILGVSEKAVEKHISHALKHCRRKIIRQ